MSLELKTWQKTGKKLRDSQMWVDRSWQSIVFECIFYTDAYALFTRVIGLYSVCRTSMGCLKKLERRTGSCFISFFLLKFSFNKFQLRPTLLRGANCGLQISFAFVSWDIWNNKSINHFSSPRLSVAMQGDVKNTTRYRFVYKSYRKLRDVKRHLCEHYNLPNRSLTACAAVSAGRSVNITAT